MRFLFYGASGTSRIAGVLVYCPQNYSLLRTARSTAGTLIYCPQDTSVFSSGGGGSFTPSTLTYVTDAISKGALDVFLLNESTGTIANNQITSGNRNGEYDTVLQAQTAIAPNGGFLSTGFTGGGRVTIPDIGFTDPPYSVEFMLAVDSLPAQGSFYVVNANNIAGTGNTSSVVLGIGNGTYSGQGSQLIMLDEGAAWHGTSYSFSSTGNYHVVVTVGTFTGTAIGAKIYINGSLVETVALNQNGGANSSYTRGSAIVGKSIYGPEQSSRYLRNARISGFVIYPSFLDSSQVTDRYNKYLAT